MDYKETTTTAKPAYSELTYKKVQAKVKVKVRVKLRLSAPSAGIAEIAKR